MPLGGSCEGDKGSEHKKTSLSGGNRKDHQSLRGKHSKRCAEGKAERILHRDQQLPDYDTFLPAHWHRCGIGAEAQALEKTRVDCYEDGLRGHS